VSCPDCGKQISDAAPACIHCGRPMRPAHGAVQTIEATGKVWKLLTLAGGLLFVISLIAVFISGGASKPPVWAAMTGGVLFILGRIGGWWRHG
jgi:uncharacterized membrane protein YvbJ